MLDYLIAPDNLPFAVALGLLGVLGAFQVVSFAWGAHPFDSVDGLLPDVDLDLDASPDTAIVGELGDGGGAFADDALATTGTDAGWVEGALSVLGMGKVPFIFSLLLFLFGFSFLGYTLQLGLTMAGLGPWPAWLAGLVTFVASLPVLRGGNDVLARVLPQDESTAVSEATFVGKVAKITLGVVTHERASEARLVDQHGRTHYVRVVADDPAEQFSAGESVIIVGRRGNLFTVVPGPAGLFEE